MHESHSAGSTHPHAMSTFLPRFVPRRISQRKGKEITIRARPYAASSLGLAEGGGSAERRDWDAHVVVYLPGDIRYEASLVDGERAIATAAK